MIITLMYIFLISNLPSIIFFITVYPGKTKYYPSGDMDIILKCPLSCESQLLCK